VHHSGEIVNLRIINSDHISDSNRTRGQDVFVYDDCVDLVQPAQRVMVGDDHATPGQQPAQGSGEPFPAKSRRLWQPGECDCGRPLRPARRREHAAEGTQRAQPDLFAVPFDATRCARSRPLRRHRLRRRIVPIAAQQGLGFGPGISLQHSLDDLRDALTYV